jgi:hypothetical protein
MLCARLSPPTTIATLVDSTVDTSSRAPNFNLDRVVAFRLSVSPPHRLFHHLSSGGVGGGTLYTFECRYETGPRELFEF